MKLVKNLIVVAGLVVGFTALSNPNAAEPKKEDAKPTAGKTVDAEDDHDGHGHGDAAPAKK